MAEVYNDPEKLLEFCHELEGHTKYWQTSIASLSGYMSRLGKSWRDEQFVEFESEVSQLQRNLNQFSEYAAQTISTLRQDAEKLKKYQSTRL